MTGEDPVNDFVSRFCLSGQLCVRSSLSGCASLCERGLSVPVGA